MIDKDLLAMLVCPKSKQALYEKDGELICEASGLAYPIDDGIAVLLVEEARELSNNND